MQTTDDRFEPAARSPRQFASEASISRSQVYEEIKAGRLTARKCGSRTLITTSPKAWLDSLPALLPAPQQ
jgi:hypothetical protein